jgi:hypothetical protein
VSSSRDQHFWPAQLGKAGIRQTADVSATAWHSQLATALQPRQRHLDGMRYPTALTFPITLIRGAPPALHDQIAAQVSTAIERGLVPAGARLPSTRTLAALLGVSRGVAVAAYDALFAMGRLHGRSGSGTYVQVSNVRPARSTQGYE